MWRKETNALDARNILQDTGVCENWLKHKPFHQADLGHRELRYRKGSPRQIETITVLPEARQKSIHGSMPFDGNAHICPCRLAASVQTMRAYPDVIDLTVYQGNFGTR